MAGSDSVFPLLTLPLELRLKIYKHLLNPDPSHEYPLYHDRYGRAAFSGRKFFEDLNMARSRKRRHEYRKQLRQQGEISRTPAPSSDLSRGGNLCCIDPRILRANRQIYSEAISILYEKTRYLIYLANPVMLQCNCGNYPDNLPDPADLFRVDTVEGQKSKNISEYPSSGIIYPYCFQRLRQINIVTARNAIWGHGEDYEYFSHIGRLIWKILKVLTDAPVPKPQTRRIKFAIEDGLSHGVDIEGIQQRIEARTIPLFGLMKAFERYSGAEVEVEKGGLTTALKELLMDETEIDKWEETLLSDTSVGSQPSHLLDGLYHW